MASSRPEQRSAGFDIADRIKTFYKGPDHIRQVMTDFAAYIKQETLSDDLVPDIPSDGPHVENLKLSGYDVTLGVQRT